MTRNPAVRRPPIESSAETSPCWSELAHDLETPRRHGSPAGWLLQKLIEADIGRRADRANLTREQPVSADAGGRK
jgi:hypothetical protein